MLTDLEERFDDALGQTDQENLTSIRLQHNDREEDEGVGVGERGQAAEEPVQSWMESRGSLKPDEVVEKGKGLACTHVDQRTGRYDPYTDEEEKQGGLPAKRHL